MNNERIPNCCMINVNIDTPVQVQGLGYLIDVNVILESVSPCATVATMVMLKRSNGEDVGMHAFTITNEETCCRTLCKKVTFVYATNDCNVKKTDFYTEVISHYTQAIIETVHCNPYLQCNECSKKMNGRGGKRK